MAWHFMDFGLLMPAAVPMDLADSAFTEDKFDFQIRGRVDSHLRYFMETYMEYGTFHDEIQYTPGMDYNVRFYTTREAYADAIRLTILDIDYEKFKPTAERLKEDGTPQFANGKVYHGVLNSIWGSVCRLGAPGGIWATRTYSASKYTPDTSLNLYKGRSRLGSSFYENEATPTLTKGDSAWDEDWNMDYIPDVDMHIGDLLSELSGVPVDQWEDYLTSEDNELMEPFKEDARRYENKTARKLRRVNKRNSRSSRSSRNSQN